MSQYSTIESWLNDLVEDTLQLFDIQWHGERNFFGSADRAINNFTELDHKELMISIPLLVIFLIMLTFSRIYPHLLLPSVTYLILIIAGLFFWNSGKAGTSYLGFGDREDFGMYLKAGISLSLIWFGMSLLTGKLFNQEMVPILQQISLTEAMPSLLFLIISSIITVFAISYVEANLFVGGLLPNFSQNLGIIPGVIILAIISSILHYVVLGANPFTVGLTIARCLMVYPVSMMYSTKSVETVSHIFSNALTTLYIMFI